MKHSPSLRRRVHEKTVRLEERKYEACASVTAMAMATPFAAPALAFAASDSVKGNSSLKKVLNLASSAVEVFGAGLAVWGAVRFGLAIQQQQGGNAIAEALATIGGGIIIIVAGVWFSTNVVNGTA
jgi:hypothetical protein